VGHGFPFLASNPEWAGGLFAAREEVVALSDRRSLKRYRLIFRAWITLRNGKRLYARDYGLKAFALTVKH